jgi:hypothetical protein
MQVDGKSAVERRIAGAFKAAADATGASFDYLLETSQRESGHRADLAAEASSAKGLFQFVDQTWLELVRREGPSVGLERLAAEIVSDGKGGWTVENATERAKILALRTDPLVCAVMAGKFTQDNARRLTEALGRAPSDGELYAAHVLGATGATRLFRLAASEPGTVAAVAFPKAAAANPGLFYEKGGRARTTAELFQRLTRPVDAEADPTTARISAAHRDLAQSAPKADAATVALLLRAQAAALVGAEKVGVTGSTGTAPTAADRALTRATLAETALPGAPEGSAAGGVDGWRAHLSRDAFSGLLRDDRTGAEAGTVFASTRVLPGVAGSQIAGAQPGTAPGALPRVDRTAPMSLAPTAPSPPLDAIDRAAPDRAPSDRAPAERPSRYAVAVATGAPAAPLPMVDAARGATRPSRLLFEQWAGPSEEALAAGVVRVRTTTVTPPRALPTPAPVFTQGSVAADGTPSPAVPTVRTTRRAAPRPLDLVALARAGRIETGDGGE